MKIQGETLSATEHFEFENLKNVREMFEQRRKPKNTEINTLYRHIPSKFWHTAVVKVVS